MTKPTSAPIVGLVQRFVTRRVLTPKAEVRFHILDRKTGAVVVDTLGVPFAFEYPSEAEFVARGLNRSDNAGGFDPKEAKP